MAEVVGEAAPPAGPPGTPGSTMGGRHGVCGGRDQRHRPSTLSAIRRARSGVDGQVARGGEFSGRGYRHTPGRHFGRTGSSTCRAGSSAAEPAAVMADTPMVQVAMVESPMLSPPMIDGEAKPIDVQATVPEEALGRSPGAARRPGSPNDARTARGAGNGTCGGNSAEVEPSPLEPAATAQPEPEPPVPATEAIAPAELAFEPLPPEAHREAPPEPEPTGKHLAEALPPAGRRPFRWNRPRRSPRRKAHRNRRQPIRQPRWLRLTRTNLQCRKPRHLKARLRKCRHRWSRHRGAAGGCRRSGTRSPGAGPRAGFTTGAGA